MSDPHFPVEDCLAGMGIVRILAILILIQTLLIDTDIYRNTLIDSY